MTTAKERQEWVETFGPPTPPPGDEPPLPPEPPVDDQPPAMPPVARSYTDDGNALRLVDAHADSFRFVPQRGTWLVWDDYRWAWDETGRIHEAARNIIRDLRGNETITKHRQKSLSLRCLRAMVSLATTDPRTVTDIKQLDADIWSLCTPAGVRNLRNGALSPPSRDQMHTRSTAVAADFDQPTPRWDTFLAETFAGDDTLASFVQRLAGYSATGFVGIHVLPFLHGPGGNGKGVFLEVLSTLLGDYAIDSPAGFLMAGPDRHPTELARLQGARMVLCSEVNQTDRFDEAKVQRLTGGDRVTGHFMRKDDITFDAQHHLWLMGNHEPEVRSGGGASFWRRLRKIPFVNTPTDINDRLAAELIATEGPGILAWIITGAIDVLEGGIRTPETVMAATAEYAAEEDHFARFVEDCCHVGGGDQVREPMAAVTKAYSKWCAEEGYRPMNNKIFGREIRRFGVEAGRSHGTKFYTGLMLLNVDDEGGKPAGGPSWYEREPPEDDQPERPTGGIW